MYTSDDRNGWLTYKSSNEPNMHKKKTTAATATRRQLQNLLQSDRSVVDVQFFKGAKHAQKQEGNRSSNKETCFRAIELCYDRLINNISNEAIMYKIKKTAAATAERASERSNFYDRLVD